MLNKANGEVRIECEGCGKTAKLSITADIWENQAWFNFDHALSAAGWAFDEEGSGLLCGECSTIADIPETE